MPSEALPAGELIQRARKIDLKTERLLRLLELLDEREGPSPVEAIRECLIEVLVEQRLMRESLSRIEQAILPQLGGASVTAPPRRR